MRLLIRLGRARRVEGRFGHPFEPAFDDLDEGAGGRREGRFRAGDERERVVERLGERGEMEAARRPGG